MPPGAFAFAQSRPVSARKEMVVLPLVLDFHLPGGPPGRTALESVRFLMLPQGSGARPEAAEGAEGPAEQTGVRRYFHDRGQGLGRRTHLRTDYYRQDPRKSLYDSYSALYRRMSLN